MTKDHDILDVGKDSNKHYLRNVLKGTEVFKTFIHEYVGNPN